MSISMMRFMSVFCVDQATFHSYFTRLKKVSAATLGANMNSKSVPHY
jgi:hypothetical protein